MRRFLFLFQFLLLTTISWGADESLIREADQRREYLSRLYNYDKNDSLIAQASQDLAFLRDHALWNYYYDTWLLLVNTYVFSGKVNTGLQEVKRMHQDATDRDKKYGLALANYAMGIAYLNMGYTDEAIDSYRQSLRLINELDEYPSCTSDVFSYYCDALVDKKHYEEMKAVTAQWRQYLEKEEAKRKRGDASSYKVWYAYYYLSCSEMHLGLGLLDEAEQDIKEVEKRADGSGDFIPMAVLHAYAQLYLQRKDYAKAYDYSTRYYDQVMNYGDISSILIAQEQRAEILRGLGRYEEAAQMYKNVHENTDSLYKRDARTQINELNTLFRVSEIEMEHELEHSRIMLFTTIFIAFALAVLVGYGYWMNRRLRKKNEELAAMSHQLTIKNEELTVALDRAGESDRMKTNFIKNVSHEIRTPLNILSGFSQMMAMPDADLPEEVRQEASLQIQENTNRITTLINELLALSETSSRTHIDRTDTVSVNQLCANAITHCGIPEKSDYHFDFITKVDDTLMIQTSEQDVVLALSHLLDNAMKFTPSGGSIRLSCAQEDTLMKIVVEDTGCGVPAEKAEEIFGEFVQLDEFKDGVGIGLPLSRHVARRLGGDIILDTSYKEGARFILTLPV
ncbi:MAG: HAMP domain-containing histidine kinase [Prevotella sp.]|nr:HAMP domain-containing histidine kinase [Prevotella sp.]